MNALIVEDLAIVRAGLRRIIELRWHAATVWEAASLAEGLARLGELKPDFILMDSSLPDAQAAEGLERLHAAADGTPILILSLNKDLTFAQQLMLRGAAGHLGKDTTGEELVRAIERILTGLKYVSPELAERMLAHLEQGRSFSTQPHERLTAQEFRVMLLICEGQKPGEIAAAMRLSPKTVSNYRTRIMEKTGWRSDAEVARYCLLHGLVAGPR